ncbi:electron transport complex subunit RsxC [Endozoicomonas montiporae]|uniref:Ion-translocating oxidoreductase complex subunit C n=1 Tax=Endozoicomonas montiporae CL-33 TaxID=570277 RepID=A0A142B9E7_9GAMM|nr:electron transport complex subunit RsxC [Endozoicomonas montiporae]AMO55373.1 RnfABCDGE type electron transport complex subunit C1 [Endozoicomonas montiporae CL-33]
MSSALIDLKEVNARVWPLTGGVHPAENKHQSTATPIRIAPLPKRLVLPLSQHAGSPAEPVVQVGDKVLKGQLIAKATGFVSVPLHAPTSGTIAAIELHAIPHPSGMHDNCIVIDTDGEDRWCELNPVDDYRQTEPAQLVDIIRNAGIAGMGGAGFPSAIKLAPKNPVHTLILNGTECEPYITADDMLMRERAEQIITGADILMHLLKTERCLIGIEDNKPEAIHAMRMALSQRQGHNIKVVVFPTRYPSGGEKQLIQILTGQEVPSGKLPADLGIVVQNVGTAAAIEEAIVHGRPLISRITTLTGEALQTPQNLQVLLGTPVNHLLQVAGLKQERLHTLIMGGPMMGFSMDDASIPVVKTSNCVIAGSDIEFPAAPPAQACIRCGMCAEACPTSLLPQQLYWHAKAENHDQLKHHNLFDCIECGACSYVCPSSIPLVQYYRASKGEIRSLEAKHAKSERSKVRYENRQNRLEREKAEKEARRKANAEKAALLKAQKAAGASTPSSSEETDPVKAAIERAKAKKAAGTTGKAGKQELTPEQKKLKIDLSMANAQLKKTQRALKKAEETGEGDTGKLKANVDMLQAQANKLQQQFDAVMLAQPAAKPAVSADEKKLKIEHAMAKAALKKAERALTQAKDSGEGDIQALQATVDDCKTKADKLAAQLDSAATPAAKPAPSAEDKKLKIEQAMAKAALKKAERALAKALEEDSAETQALQESVDECRTKLKQLTLTPVAAEPSAQADKPKPAKPAQTDEVKKLKIENAMAKAALKKAQRAVDQADATTPELEAALNAAKEKAAAAQEAFEAHL